MKDEEVKKDESPAPPVEQPAVDPLALKRLIARIRNPQDKRWAEAIVGGLVGLVNANMPIPMEPKAEAFRTLFVRLGREIMAEIEMQYWSGWECQLFGNPKTTVRPRRGEVPGWFRRGMQTIFFGHKWKKLR